MKTNLWTPDKRIHLPTPDLIGFFLEIGAWDKAGKLYHQERILSKSPVQQFLEIILSQVGEQNIAVTDTSNVAKTIDFDGLSTKMGAAAALNASAYGIVIGTDPTAVDMTDYQLAAQIVNGNGAGQMIHNAVAVDATVTVADPDATFDLYRNFNNNSGDTITIKETGIYAKSKDTAGVIYLMIIRDIPTQVAVVDGGGCYVKYTLKITE